MKSHAKSFFFEELGTKASLTPQTVGVGAPFICGNGATPKLTLADLNPFTSHGPLK